MFAGGLMFFSVCHLACTECACFFYFLYICAVTLASVGDNWSWLVKTRTLHSLSGLCWGWELFVVANHPASVPFYQQWELIKELSALLSLTNDWVYKSKKTAICLRREVKMGTPAHDLPVLSAICVKCKHWSKLHSRTAAHGRIRFPSATQIWWNVRGLTVEIVSST